jgi:hypothetical protein
MWGYGVDPPTDLNPHDGPRPLGSCTRVPRVPICMPPGRLRFPHPGQRQVPDRTPGGQLGIVDGEQRPAARDAEAGWPPAASVGAREPRPRPLALPPSGRRGTNRNQTAHSQSLLRPQQLAPGTTDRHLLTPETAEPGGAVNRWLGPVPVRYMSATGRCRAGGCRRDPCRGDGPGGFRDDRDGGEPGVVVSGRDFSIGPGPQVGEGAGVMARSQSAGGHGPLLDRTLALSATVTLLLLKQKREGASCTSRQR